MVIGLVACAHQSDTNIEVRTAGAMRNVMWKGQLEGTIASDSLAGSASITELGQ